ncbi:hypothetical protein [Nocardia sp. CWNU-33]|uniref:hypothetical protein n=1 Tax=Nocardia sp. CWNU-33 TaxID=3392117 RepID=UPI00398F4C2A
MADLSDAGSKQALLDFGPLVVHRLGLLAPAALTQYSSTDELDDPYSDGPRRILITLEESGRRAKVVLEDVFGQDFDEALHIPVHALRGAIAKGLESDITSEFEERDYVAPVVGPPSGRMFIEIDNLTYDRHDDIFEIHGSFDVDMTCFVAVVGGDGSTDHLQADAAVHGRFSVPFWQDDTGSGQFESGDPALTDWQNGPVPW